MPVLINHGGHCCGVRHIYSFGRYPTAEAVCQLDRILSRVSVGLMLEVVLTNSQTKGKVDGKTWPDILMERGFHLVERSKNPNTGSILNMFIRPSRATPARPPHFRYNKSDRV